MQTDENVMQETMDKLMEMIKESKYTEAISILEESQKLEKW